MAQDYANMCEGKAVAEDVAHVWERGGLPHRQADSRIVIAVLDRAIRIKENKTKKPISVVWCILKSPQWQRRMWL